MQADNPPRAPKRAANVIAWSLVGVSTLATAGTAIAGATGGMSLPPYAVAGSAAVLLASSAYAGARTMVATRIAKECEEAYEIAFASEVAARDRLSFARHTAVLMAAADEGEGVQDVLQECLTRFSVDAAAVVGDDITLVTAEGIERQQAQAGVLHVALETVRAGRAVAKELADDGATALTVPLRIRGQLKHVMVLWRRGAGFNPDDLDGLSLVARIVELSMENQVLLDSVRDQLTGTLHMMVDLVEQRLPNYGAYSEHVAHYAVALGRAMGMLDDEIEDLRFSALLHDVGMLAIPESILNAPRRLTLEEQFELRGHPSHGAELTRVANFSPRVQEAIEAHHEHVDGTGYPNGLKGDAIPLAARILAVCDSFVALVSDRPHRAKVSVGDALIELRAGVGTCYDVRVVRDFIRLQTEALCGEEPELTDGDLAALVAELA